VRRRCRNATLLSFGALLAGCVDSGVPQRDVAVDWLDASGHERLQMRIPPEWVLRVTRDGPTPYGTHGGATNGDKNNGVFAVLLRGALGADSDTSLAPLAAPRRQRPTVPWVRIMLTADHGVYGKQWERRSSWRSQNEYAISKGDMRQLKDKFGLEHYRPQACGHELPKDVDRHPLLPDEEPREGCRDLAVSEEYMAILPDESDGVFIQCVVYGPFECRTETTFRGWHLMYMFPRDQLERWREIRAKVNATLGAFLIGEPTSSDHPVPTEPEWAEKARVGRGTNETIRLNWAGYKLAIPARYIAGPAYVGGRVDSIELLAERSAAGAVGPLHVETDRPQIVVSLVDQPCPDHPLSVRYPDAYDPPIQVPDSSLLVHPSYSAPYRGRLWTASGVKDGVGNDVEFLYEFNVEHARSGGIFHMAESYGGYVNAYVCIRPNLRARLQFEAYLLDDATSVLTDLRDLVESWVEEGQGATLRSRSRSNREQSQPAELLFKLSFSEGHVRSMSYRHLMGRLLQTAITRKSTAGGERLFGSAKDDALTITGGYGFFYGGHGNDTLIGASDGVSKGGNVYLYEPGDGSDRIVDEGNRIVDDVLVANVLRFGAGIKPEDIEVDTANGTVLHFGRSADTITLETADPDGAQSRAVDHFEFSDGTVLTHDQLMQRVPIWKDYLTSRRERR